MAKKDDPTVRSLRGAAPEYPEGTHPPHPVSEQTWGPDRFSYSDMPAEDKPEETTVAQVVDEDPIEVANREALAEATPEPGAEATPADQKSSK
jgi:hypothetical protein